MLRRFKCRAVCWLPCMSSLHRFVPCSTTTCVSTSLVSPIRCVHSVRGMATPTPQTSQLATDDALESVIRNAFENVKKHPRPKGLPDDSGVMLKNSLCPKNDLDQLRDLILGSNRRHLFVRAPVGSGKSTMGRLLYQYSPGDVFLINLSRRHLKPKTMRKALRSALGAKNWPQLRKNLDGKMLIVDECHILFCHEDILDLLIKEGLNCYLLMFSSTGAHQSASHDRTSSPVIVTNKCFMDLRFSRDDIDTMVGVTDVPLSLYKQVQTGAISKHETRAIVIQQLESLFCGQRLLTVYALRKLHNCLKTGAARPKPYAFDAVIQLLHHHLREGVFDPKALGLCRSAIINSGFEELYKGQLICSQVLCDGQIDTSKDATAKQYVSTLLTRGGIQPVSSESSVFSWTNPFVARFYESSYRNSIFPRVCKTDTISLVLLGLAWMDIGEYMKESTDTYGTRFFLQMPFESQFQSALMSGWKRFGDKHERIPVVLEVVEEEVEITADGNDWESNRGETAIRGRVDVRLRVGGEKESSFVELLVLGKPVSTPSSDAQIRADKANKTTIKDHIDPFFTGFKNEKGGKVSYTEALAQGKEVVVVVFAHIEMRADAVKRARNALVSWKNHKHAEKLKVLVLGMRSAFRYSVDVVQLQKDSREVAPTIEGKEELLANLNAKCIREDGTLVSNQRQPTTLEHLSAIQHPVALRPHEVDEPICDFLRRRVEEKELVRINELVEKKVTMSAWVREANVPNSATFDVMPAKNDVASLKDAIKKKKPNRCKGIDADEIQVHPPSKAIAPELSPQEQAAISLSKLDATTNESKKLNASVVKLQPTTGESAYTFTI